MLNFEQIEKFLGMPLTEQEKNHILSLEENPITRGFDLTGKIFQRIIVLGRGPTYTTTGGHKVSQWWCLCCCPAHTIFLARTANLQSNNTKSCGCLNREKSKARIVEVGHNMAKDISGQTFSELTAIKPTSERNNGSVVWECQCSCGRIHYASAKDLINNRIRSCGHIVESYGSKKIKEILIENNINFITEKTFPTCKFPDTNASARFDFYLPDYNMVIEFDGIQHFKECDEKFFSDSLEKRQQHDAFKSQWCKDNNIILHRIPYTAEQDLSLNLILGK